MKKVFLEFYSDDLQWSYPMSSKRFHDFLPNHGWSVSDTESADLHFRDSHMLEEELCKPTIAFIRMDTSWPPASIKPRDGQENVVGFCVPIMTTDPSLSVSRFIHKPGGEFKIPVFCLTSMIWHQLDIQKWYHDINPVDNLWDVSFIGTMHHLGNEFVKEHRANLRRAWGTLDEFSSVSVFNADVRLGYIIPWNKTWEIIKRSRTIVSPWGVCEISWRDYEAALGGCMMIKPRQPEIKVTCSPWHDENVIYCEPDYSDLANRVRDSLDATEFSDQQKMLIKISQETLATGLDFNLLAKALCEILDQCST